MDAGFVNGFSTRLGGVSPFPSGDLNLAGYDEDSAERIEENRRRFLNVFGGDWQLATVWQVHGDEIRSVLDVEEIKNSEERADGVISRLDGVLAGVKTADCVPVLMGDPVTQAYAAVHAGWRGTAEMICAKAIRKLTAIYGTDPRDLICAIGPAASCRSYEVGAEVAATFAMNLPGSERFFTPKRDGHSLVDLHGANKDQLNAAGVMHDKIYSAPYCTMERPDLFFSYRLEKKRFGKTGRLLSVIGREPTSR